MKNKSHRYGINSIRSSYGQKYSKYKKVPQYDDAYMECIKVYLH